MNSASEQTTASNERARSPFGFLRKNAEPAVAAPTPAPAGDQPSARPAESPFGFLRKNAALAVAAPVGDQPVVKPAVSPFAFLSKSSQLKQAQQVEEVVGRLVSFRTVNDWAVGTVYTKNNEQVSVTGGALIGLTEGIEYSFSGSWKSHPKHGDAFQVGDVQVHLTLDIDSMTKYIVAVFKGIGQARATQFLDAARKRGGDEELERIRQVLVRAPSELDLSSVSKRAVYVGETNEDNDLARRSTVYRDLATRIGHMMGVRAAVLKHLAQWLVAECGPYESASVPADLTTKAWAMFSSNPYAAIEEEDVEGYGFSMADAIGRSLNIPRTAPFRLTALVQYAVRQGCEVQGHSYLNLDDLVRAIGRIDPAIDPQDALKVAKDLGAIQEDDAGRFYEASLLAAEKRLARKVASMMKFGDPIMQGTEKSIREKVQAKAKAMGFKDGLDESQVNAITGILRSRIRLHTLSGGPGCGKTSVMEVLTAVARHRDFVFATPTGKAAKVLSARLKSAGATAGTLHSTLGGQGPGSFRHCAENRLRTDVFGIDESSMPDLRLMDAAFSAVSNRAHIILLGDPDQLPSIGPGTVFKDLLSIPNLDNYRLTTTHRNSGGILELVRSCAAGDLDIKDSEAVTFSHTLGSSASDIAQVFQAYTDAVARVGHENVILLMSRRKGKAEEPAWNTTYANARLRDICNPHGGKIPGTSFFVGDRIIIRANTEVPRYGANEEPIDGAGDRVVNGDTGTIVNYMMPKAGSKSIAARWLDIELDDGRFISVPGKMADILGWSYALTVHAGQGSEYKEVILVATPGHASFVNRNMLLTGLSRARDRLHVFGNDADLIKIAATPAPARNSALVERVYDGINRPDSHPANDANDSDDGDGEEHAHRHPESQEM